MIIIMNFLLFNLLMLPVSITIGIIIGRFIFLKSVDRKFEIRLGEYEDES